MEKTVMTRAERIEILSLRDGTDCFLCTKPFKFEEDITFDHWIPRSKGGTWDLENLRLAHKRCNALKGDRIPNPDGTLPDVVRTTKFRSRQVKRSERPDLCQKCTNGRSLGPFESCDVCKSGPMPERFPRWAKVKSSECDHEDFWCWACGSGLIERKPTINNLLGM